MAASRDGAINQTPRWCLAATGLSFALFGLCGAFARFQVSLNDFWNVVWYARHLDWRTPESWYNGFFPVGYPLLLRMLPEHGFLVSAYLLNCLFAAILIGAVCTLLAAPYGRIGAALGLALGLCYPEMFGYAHLPGPDTGAGAMTALAVLLLWMDALRREPPAGYTRTAIARHAVAGALLGLATLWRTHAAVSGIALIACYWLARGGLRPSRDKLALTAAFLGVSAIQIAVNLASGHGPLETAQEFNIYEVIYGVNYWYPPTRIESTMIELIADHPLEFLRGYAPELVKLLFYLWPCAACLLLRPGNRSLVAQAHSPLVAQAHSLCRTGHWPAPQPERLTHERAVRRFALFSGATIMLYSLVTAAGASPRASAVIMPMYLTCICILMIETGRRLRPKASPRLGLAAALLATAAAAWFIRANVLWIRALRMRHAEFLSAEYLLRREGLTAARQVFTDDFSLYFPGLTPESPRRNGGWARYSLYAYNEESPDLSVQSADQFMRDAHAAGVRFVALTSSSGGLADFLARLYEHGAAPGLPAHSIGAAGRFKLFKLDAGVGDF